MKSKVRFVVSALIICSIHFTYAQHERIESRGDFLQIALPVTALTSTLILEEHHQHLWKDIKAFSASIILTHSLKVFIDKERPNGAKDGYAFPSGHTSCAFAGATLLNKRFGWKVGVPAYILAGYVGWTRIRVDRHDVWDVIAGSVVGIGSIYLFTNKKNETQFKISRVNGYSTFGIAMRF